MNEEGVIEFNRCLCVCAFVDLSVIYSDAPFRFSYLFTY